MSSSILDLSLSRGLADTSSRPTSRRSTSRHSPSTSTHHDNATAELRVTTDHDHGQATSSDTGAHDDFHAADTDDKEVTVSERTVISGSSSDVSDDAGSRDHLRHAPRDENRSSQYLDYHAAAAARFLVPYLPSPAASTGSASSMTSPVPGFNFYPFPFTSMLPPPEVGFHFRPDSASCAAASSTSGHAEGSSRSTEARVKVKDEGGLTSPAGALDPSYAERRRKNNEAARRSRDARRMKERETSLRAALLQQENVRLRAEMAVLKTEITRLHCLLYDKM